MDPAAELRFLILGAQREGARLLAQQLRPLGLTAAQAEVLAVLRDAGGPLSLREIGERLVCEAGSPSRLVASMVDAGLVARDAEEGDRRAVRLSLTRRGAAAARKVGAVEEELHAQLGSAFGERELATLVKSLRKLVDGRSAGAAIARRRED